MRTISTIHAFNMGPSLYYGRTFGFFLSHEDAEQAVTQNRCDMHERKYFCLVIEQFQEGVHPSCVQRQFYKWDDEKWVKMDEPESLTNIRNFAIG